MNNKILFVITRGDIIGGAQSHLLILCEKLINENRDIAVIVGGKDTILKKRLDEMNILTKEINWLKRDISFLSDLISFLLLLKYFISIKPKLVSVHSSKVGLLARIASFFLRIPVVFTAHGWSFTEGVDSLKRRQYIKIETFLSSISSKIIVVSSYDYHLALKEKVCSSEKIILIHNGIIDTKMQRKFNETKTINIAMVARFDLPKDQLKLIKSVTGLANVKLHLVGDGPMLNQAKEFVNSNNLNAKVVFTGFVENVIELLTDMDIFALISNYEGFPMSTLEAMSVGLPIVISNVGGASEAVINGENGLLVNNDISSITKALQILSVDEKVRNRMGQRSRQFFLENFEASTMVSKTLNLFDSIILDR
jgi:glycosyltransferase involved in cell wall biosynthesis